MRTIIAALAMVLIADVANAQEHKQHVVMGFGVTTTCGVFAAQYRAAPEEAENRYFAWAQAFMSGLNMRFDLDKNVTAQSHDLNAMSLEEEKEHIRIYCNNHPLESYIGAILDLYSDLPTIKR
jgi:hypothetical protein